MRNRVTGFFSLFIFLYVCLILFLFFFFFAVVVVVVADLVCLFAFFSLFSQVKKNVNIIIRV